MGSNFGAIQLYSYDSNTSLDEENKDVHGFICQQVDALIDWSRELVVFFSSFCITATAFFKTAFVPLLRIHNDLDRNT